MSGMHTGAYAGGMRFHGWRTSGSGCLVTKLIRVLIVYTARLETRMARGLNDVPYHHGPHFTGTHSVVSSDAVSCAES